MCGIAGYFGPRPLSRSVREGMLAPLRPRGPDARGTIQWDPEFRPLEPHAPAPHALLHTRLSIRDPSAGANQPMASPDHQVWICYNGEVYGWHEEATALTRRGFAFRTRGDTEFILNAYLAHGLEGCLERLRGMFAFAILDLRHRTLLLARDRLGIKPLLYGHGPQGFAFASTVRALIPWLPPGECRFDPEAIDAYLTHRYIPAPRTILPAVRRLPPAHWARVDLTSGTLTLQRYWNPQPVPSQRPLEEVTREAILLRLESDLPVGVFLSGGIDSATVASVLAADGGERPICYTAAFPGSELDEAPTAAAIAAQLELPHHPLPIRPRVEEDFAQLVADLDEPFADPSLIPLWYLARETRRRGVRVVMGGDGGDELFAGYKRYRKHLGKAWRGGLRLPLSPRGGNQLPGRWAKLADEAAMTWLQAYVLRFSGMPPSLRRHLQPDLAPLPSLYWRELPPPGGDPLETLLAIDLANYLPEYILRKADLCTMAHGLELRVPLLDHRLLEGVLALPPAHRFTTPPKQALAPLCPPCRELGLFRNPKRGFNPPLGSWLRQEWRQHLEGLGERLAELTGGQLAAPRCQGLVAAFLAGREGRAEQVFQLLILATSLEQLHAHGQIRLH